MVRVLKQNTASRAAFQNWVATKQQSERHQKKEALKGILPNEVVELFSGLQQFENSLKGGMGEAHVFFRTLFYLPDTWVIFNDVVLELGTHKFAQLDHVLIGEPGVFIIETKAWKGSFLGHLDLWKRQDQFQGWIECSSPTTQNLRHARLFREWIASLLPFKPPASLELWVVPVVVMTKAKWLRTTQCSMPVLWGVSRLLEYLTTREKLYLTPEQVNQISQLIANPPQPTSVTSAPPVTTAPIKKTSVPPVKPPSVTPIKKETVAAAKNCRQCRSHNLSIEFGYSYYFKCLNCGANSRIDLVCTTCGAKEKIRKDGLQFYAECHSCGTSNLFHTNATSWENS